jgi:hypothetical protein
MALHPDAFCLRALVVSIWCFEPALGTDASSRFNIIPDNYNANLPPPTMANPEPLKVHFGLTIKSMDFDIMSSKLSIDYWFRLSWLDTRLFYNGATLFGANFNSATSYVPTNVLNGDSPNIWVPDIMCFNATDATAQAYTSIYASVFPQEHVTPETPSNVLLIRPGSMKAHCKPDLEWFPYDKQNCKLHFASWAFSGSFVEMSLMDGGFQKTVDSPDSNEYQWSNISASTQTIEFEVTEGEPWSEAVLSLDMRRLPRYFALNAVLPMFMMVIISQLAFWIPINPNSSGSGERLSFSITCLLTIVAVGLFTADKRPMIGVTTWLDRWIANCLLLTTLPLLETVFVFFLDAIFRNITDSMETADKITAKHSTARTSFSKYADIVADAHTVEAQQSKKVMKVVSIIGEHCWCFVFSPRRIDAVCRHVLPIISLGKLMYELDQVKDMWAHWTPQDSSAYYTIYIPFLTLGIVLCLIGLVWCMITNFRICCKGQRMKDDGSDTESETETESQLLTRRDQSRP